MTLALDREHDRIPVSIEVKFRTTSSFLFAYSVNLSKGGMFLETDELEPIGSPLTLKFQIADAGTHEVRGTVSWVRERVGDDDFPSGMGIEFDAIDDALGDLIDELVTQFQGLTVLLFCPDARDRSTVARMIRSIVSTADVVEAGGTSTVEALLGPEIDLLVADGDAEDGGGFLVLRAAKSRDKKIPVIIMSNDPGQREHAVSIGADEVIDNPPVFAEFQELLLHALGRPSTVS